MFTWLVPGLEILKFSNLKSGILFQLIGGQGTFSI